ncbi:conjugative plasmid protein (pARN3) [Acidianus ambivalens]|uniref:Conjugative plasmid protein (PARN3) n=1 Tax=Acidianus ambivalens TaxID=2283 RepID=A0A650CW66_ACIAM|nr:conjugative plasmid protein (pARN3) [Acidianus ambivalens]MQL54259.1 conjugative plasmid protein (pARN3) [Acidianus ambivalens]QGR22086.1 conjugative plasmid protein (pARN3) [Acidianus ambivalens]
MRKFNYNEIVVLNPMQTRYQMMTSRVFVPLYAAANDGIYRMNRAKRMGGFIATLGIAIGIIILAFITIFVIYFLVSVALRTGFNYPVYWIPTLIGVGVIMGSVFGIIKLVKIGKRFGRIANELEGELVVSWSQVKSIVIMNVRQENVANRPSLILNIIAPIYKEIGDWHVLTVDGRDITILDVDDPYNKLNYVKNRFNLNFS